MSTTDQSRVRAKAAGAAEGSQHTRRWWILALLGIAQLMVVLDATIVNIALPHAQAALGCAAQNFSMLLVGRVVQGAFGALLAPAALSLLTTTFTRPEERGKAMGIYSGIAGAGASVGLLLGGV